MILPEAGSELFLPDPARGAEIDARVRDRVADSLSHLGVALGAQRPDAGPTLQRLVGGLRSEPVPAAVFAVYADIVLAIEEEDSAAVLSALQAAAAVRLASPSSLAPLALSDDYLGEGFAARYLRHVDDDPENQLAATAPSADEYEAAKANLGAAIDMIAAADPLLEQEIRNLAREVVFAVNDGGVEFGGITAFHLWGAQIVNVRVYRNPEQLAEAIVHEAAHALLFGHSLGEPLVENDPDERYASPLREDLRPMDGIVHASFVLARLHYFLTRPLLAVRDVQRRAAEYRDQFRTTDDVIMHNARFTPTGEALYLAARAYMLPS